jgi:hypothetical protein
VEQAGPRQPRAHRRRTPPVLPGMIADHAKPGRFPAPRCFPYMRNGHSTRHKQEVRTRRR